MLKNFYFFLICFLSGHLLSAQVPKIDAFSPLFGLIGSSVTITGSNFSAIPDNNIVYFGATRAVVSSSSTSSITVTVPPGATYQPIAITVNGLTSYSTQSFIVTFTGAGNITYGNFTDPVDSLVGLLPHGICVSDFNGDGKPDIVTPNLASGLNSVSVLKNTGRKGIISFSPDVEFATGVNPYSVITADLDGDGKPDIITTDVNNGNINGVVSVLRNISTSDNIAFAPHIDFTASSSPYSAAIGDIDGDGKPDIIVVNFFSNTVSVFRNISTPGAILFQNKIDYTVGSGPENVAVGDIDGDGKPDIAVTNFSSSSITIYKNQSSVGNISLVGRLDIVSGVNNPYDIELNDIDGDGKMDIAISNYNYTSTQQSTVGLSLFRNTSTTTAITFAPKIDYIYGDALKISFADMNGDGRADIILPTRTQQAINIFQNKSVAGSFSFTQYAINNLKGPLAACAADLDADGKTDIASVNYTGNTVSLIRNKITEPDITSIVPSTAKQGDTVSLYGPNLTGTTMVKFGGVPASSFMINSSGILRAVVGEGASGKVTVSTPNGNGQSSSQFIFAGAPIINSFTPSTMGLGTTVTISGVNLLGATSVSFGGIAAQSFSFLSDTSIAAVVGNGGPGNISVRTPYGTATISGILFIPPPVIVSFSPTAVQSGSTVSIKGQNLATATAVSFGGTPAISFNVTSDTTLTAIAGRGTSGKINITTAYGSITKDSFFVLPTIYSFSPTTGRTGTTITIHGFNFTGVKAVSFCGIPADSVIVISDSVIQATVGAGNISNDSIFVINAGGATTTTGFTFISPPSITGFSPANGPVGTIVTISGKNFSSDINNLTVYFGSIKAKVISANSNSILAFVPNVTDYSLLNINCYGLTAYSAHPFITTFTNSDTVFNSGSFSKTLKLNAKSDVTNFVFADLDGDNKMEVIEQRESAKQIAIIKNKSVIDTLSLLPEIIYPTNYIAGKTTVKDFDGDGKPDIMVLNEVYSNTLSLFKNTSSNGNISFATRVDLPLGFNESEGAVGDINGDGRPDIAVIHDDYPSNLTSISIYLNTSNNGIFSFSKSISINLGVPPNFTTTYINIRDIDGDGKQDIILGYPTLTILRNTSSQGMVSFSSINIL